MTWNYVGTLSANAEWSIPTNGVGPWVEYFDVGDPDMLELLVNGLDLDWLGTTDGVNFSAHTYSPTHVYRLYLTGTGIALDFHIEDTQYTDSSLFLQVEISTVPKPATLMLLGLGGLLICTQCTT